MTVSAGQEPSRLDQAHTRLSGAIERLEKAVDARLAAGAGSAETPDAGGAPGDDAERAALADRAAELERENAELRQTNETVSQRLDQAIRRLKAAIGE